MARTPPMVETAGGVSGAETGPIRVLVVDDVEANLVAMEALLSDLGCDVVLARSGNDALKSLLKSEFALLLLDVQMPGMDGYEVATYARQHPTTRDLPIIFLTAANSTEENVTRNYGGAAVDYLFKPLNPAILRSKVRVFLELYSLRQKLAQAQATIEKGNAELARVVVEIDDPLALVLSHLEAVRLSLAEIETENRVQLATDDRSRWDQTNARIHEMGACLEKIRDLVVTLRS